MKSRLLALCMMFLLIAALVPGVMAQDANMLCGNLSADDCTALTTAFTNTGAAGSGAFSLSSTIDVQSDDPSQATKIEITADGKFNGYTMMSMADMTAMSTDPAAALTASTESLKGVSAELNLSIGLPAEAAAMTGGEPLILNLILIDGNLYIDLSKFPASIAPMLQQMQLPNGWYGIDLIDTLTNAGGMMTGSMPTTPATTPDMAKVTAMASKYLTYTRDGDTFTGDVDFAGLLMDADFQAMMIANGAKPPTEDDKASMAALSEATFQVVLTLAGDKLGGMALTIEFPESVMTAMNATSTSSTPPPTAMSLSFDLQYSGLGEAQAIAAPAGAPVAKFVDLMTLFGGMMGGAPGA